MLLLEVGAALALLLALLWLHLYLTEPPRVTGRDRRRGGYIKPPASLVLSPGVTSTTGVTLTLVGGSSSSGEPGPASAGVATLPKPRRPSSGTALGWSTAVTGDLGASGARLAAAGSTDYRPGCAAYNPSYTPAMAEANSAAITAMISASRSPVGELAVTGSAPSGVNDGRGDDRRDRLPVPGDVSITNLRGFVWPDGYTRYYQDGAA